MGSLTYRISLLLLALSTSELGCVAMSSSRSHVVPTMIQDAPVEYVTVVEIRPRLLGPPGVFGVYTVVVEDRNGYRYLMPYTVYKTDLKPGNIIACRWQLVPNSIYIDAKALVQ